MTTLEFTVYSVPVAQPRQRHRIFRSRSGVLLAGNYIPKRDPVNPYKFQVRETARRYMNGDGLWEGPLGMQLEVYLPRPKRLDTGRKSSPLATWHFGQKDADNLYKSVADSLTGVVYRNDGQLCNVTIQKFYHERAGMPRVFIKIWKMG